MQISAIEPRGSKALEVKSDQEVFGFQLTCYSFRAFFFAFCLLKMASRIVHAFKEHPILQQTHLVFYVRVPIVGFCPEIDGTQGGILEAAKKLFPKNPDPSRIE